MLISTTRDGRLPSTASHNPFIRQTDLGLLTVDLPAGVHVVHKRWTGTLDAGVAGYVTLATLAVLVIVFWRSRRWRWLALVPAVLAIVGVTALLWPPDLRTVAAPRQAVVAHGVELAGFWVQQKPDDLVIYPTWVVREAPPADLRMRWQIIDETGKVVGESITRPYFNALSAANWPAGTLVDDAAQLPAPAGLPAGRYQIGVSLGVNAQELVTAPVVIGEFDLAAPVPLRSSTPRHQVCRALWRQHRAGRVRCRGRSRCKYT